MFAESIKLLPPSLVTFLHVVVYFIDIFTTSYKKPSSLKIDISIINVLPVRCQLEFRAQHHINPYDKRSTFRFIIHYEQKRFPNCKHIPSATDPCSLRRAIHIYAFRQTNVFRPRQNSVASIRSRKTNKHHNTLRIPCAIHRYIVNIIRTITQSDGQAT